MGGQKKFLAALAIFLQDDLKNRMNFTIGRFDHPLPFILYLSLSSKLTPYSLRMRGFLSLIKCKVIGLHQPIVGKPRGMLIYQKFKMSRKLMWLLASNVADPFEAGAEI